MTANNFIPVGRTSLLHRGDLSLQVQTEYASRPSPRITTTILKQGMVLHKVERPLEQPVVSLDEQHRVEAHMQRQHLAVLETIEAGGLDASAGIKAPVKIEELHKPLTFSEALAAIPGVQRIYRLDAKGNFAGGGESTEQFKKLFSSVLKNLKSLLDLFGPISHDRRERGVYEVERNRLYFICDGAEFYFVLVYPVGEELNYEFTIRAALTAQAKTTAKA